MPALSDKPGSNEQDKGSNSTARGAKQCFAPRAVLFPGNVCWLLVRLAVQLVVPANEVGEGA